MFDYYSLFCSTNDLVSSQIDYEDAWKRQLEREKFKKRFEENSKICASYKIKELLPSGEFKVIKVWGNDEYGDYGMMITKIDSEYKGSLKSYLNKDNQIELSTNGDEFWKKYNECMAVIDPH